MIFAHEIREMKGEFWKDGIPSARFWAKMKNGTRDKSRFSIDAESIHLRGGFANNPWNLQIPPPVQEGESSTSTSVERKRDAAKRNCRLSSPRNLLARSAIHSIRWINPMSANAIFFVKAHNGTPFYETQNWADQLSLSFLSVLFTEIFKFFKNKIISSMIICDLLNFRDCTSIYFDDNNLKCIFRVSRIIGIARN